MVALGIPVAVGAAEVVYFPVEEHLARLGIRIIDSVTISFQFSRWLSLNVTRFDIVHIYSVYSFTSVAAGTVCRRHGIPYVVSPVGNLDPYLGRRSRVLKGFHLALAGRRLLEGAAVVHLMSRGEQKLVASYNIHCRQAVIGFGLDLGLYAHAVAGAGRDAENARVAQTIIFLGRIAPSKGLDLLIRAFEGIARRRHDVYLLLVGPDQGGYMGALRATQSPEAAARTEFTGFVSEEEKIAAMAHSDIFVMPSYTEAFGIALLEAMASGLPVILTKRAALAEEVANADAALIVDSSVSAVADAIELLLDDIPLRRALAAAGERFVRANFGWQKVLPEFLNMYRDCLVRTGQPAPIELRSE